MPPIDLVAVLLICVGLAVAVALAVLAGTITARLFFTASRTDSDEERS